MVSLVARTYTHSQPQRENRQRRETHTETREEMYTRYALHHTLLLALEKGKARKAEGEGE